MIRFDPVPLTQQDTAATVTDRFASATDRLFDKLVGWVESFFFNLPNLVVAVVFMALVAFLARWIRRLTIRFMDRFPTPPSLDRFTGTVASILFILMGLILTLSILDLDQTVSSFLAGAGIAGLVIGLAMQDTLSNTVAGVILSVRKLYNLGDHIEVEDFSGKITKIGLRNTELRAFTGQAVILPNRFVLENPLLNYTLLGERRVDLECGIAYGDDLEKVEKVTRSTVEEQVDYDKNRKLDFFYTGFGDSSIQFIVRFWLNVTDNPSYLGARSAAIKAIKKAYDEHGITIPFPIRTLDFGVVGGEPLRDHLAVSGESSLSASREDA